MVSITRSLSKFQWSYVHTHAEATTIYCGRIAVSNSGSCDAANLPPGRMFAGTNLCRFLCGGFSCLSAESSPRADSLSCRHNISVKRCFFFFSVPPNSIRAGHHAGRRLWFSRQLIDFAMAKNRTGTSNNASPHPSALKSTLAKKLFPCITGLAAAHCPLLNGMVIHDAILTRLTQQQTKNTKRRTHWATTFLLLAVVSSRQR